MTVTKESLVTSKDKSRAFKNKLGYKPSIFEWVRGMDHHGELWLLEETYGSVGAGIPAFTLGELLAMLSPMNTLTFLIFCYRTRLKPDAVADYVMSKL